MAESGLVWRVKCDEENAGAGGGRAGPIARRVLMTSPFPAPLPILAPLAISEEASVTVKRSDVSERKSGGSVSEAQVWLIDHSRLEMPVVLRRRERAEGEAEDVEERVRRVRGLWRHATRLVVEQLRRDKEDALQPTYTIGGQLPGLFAQPTAAQWSSDPIASQDGEQHLHIFRLPKRKKGGLSAAAGSSSSRASGTTLPPVSAARVPTSPRADHRVSVGRRPSMSLSSSIAPVSSVMSDVSVLSSESSSASPASPQSQSSHFVIPAALQRYSKQPYYAHHKRRGEQ